MERQVADGLAGRVRERIGDRGDDRALRALADAERPFGRTIDQRDGDLRHLRHGEDRIVRPVAREDSALIELHFLVQRPARSLDDAALDLVDKAVRVDHEPGVGSAGCAANADAPFLPVDLDLGNDRHVAAKVLVFGKADAAAADAVALGAWRPLQSYVWQDYDLCPKFPELTRFLT